MAQIIFIAFYLRCFSLKKSPEIALLSYHYYEISILTKLNEKFLPVTCDIIKSLDI